MSGVICSPTVTGWSATADEFSLLFENNPLAEFVELPDSCYNLRYSNILCGAIKGALEMVSCKRILWPPKTKAVDHLNIFLRSTLRCFAGLFKTLWKVTLWQSWEWNSSEKLKTPCPQGTIDEWYWNWFYTAAAPLHFLLDSYYFVI